MGTTENVTDRWSKLANTSVFQGHVAGAVAANDDGVLIFVAPQACTIDRVVAHVGTAPAGADMQVDVNINGTTAFTTQANRPIIPDGEDASSETLPDVRALAAGDRVTFDVDQIGSGTAGSDLAVSVYVS